MQHAVMRSQQKLEKFLGIIKRKQRPFVKSHHVKNIFAILLENTLISEMCFLLPNYGKPKIPLALRKQ